MKAPASYPKRYPFRKQVAWLRLKFEQEPDRLKLVILASQPSAATASQDVQLDSSRIRFAVTAGSAQLIFEGRFEDDKISGMDDQRERSRDISAR